MKKALLFLLLSVLYSVSGKSATFSSVSSGLWSTASTWNITGTDADGLPDADDNVVINAAHTVTLSANQSYAQSLIINNSGNLAGNSKILTLKGNFTINGKVIGTLTFNVQGNCVFSSSTQYTNPGNWSVTTGTLTISASTSIAKINYINIYGGAVVNMGNVSLTGGSFSGRWINETNSVLTIARNISAGAVLTATASGNSVIYNNSLITEILPTTYYDLTVNANSTKILKGNTAVLNHFILGTGTTNVLNMGNFNLTVGGNWDNNANTTLTNQGVITFNTSGSQTISRAGGNEVFSNMVVNGTGTTLLNKNIDISQSLTINNGTLDINASNFTINLGGNLVNNATLNCRAGNINVNGSSAQTISGTSNTRFYNLTLNNSAGLTINSPQSLSNILTVTSGNFNSNGNFTLLSDASSTARIAPVTGSFSGTMAIQKFISGRVKGWHDLSSPVQSTTINDWDDEMYMSGIGPYDGIVGPAGVDGNTGNNFKSVYTYSEPQAKYIEVTGSSTPLQVGIGYETWLADDQTSWFAKVIDTRGVPNFGTKVISCSFAGPGSAKGYNLIGNPFASAITFSACTRTRVNANILFLDGSGNVTSYGSNATIPAHQGFWVIANGAAASISIPENAKSTDVTTSHYRKNEDYGIKMVFSTPMLPYYNENTINFETGAGLGFDNDLDAPYIKSPIRSAPAMFMINNENNGQMITNAIGTDADEVTIPLGYYAPLEGVYYIQPNVLNTNGYNYTWIENTKTGEKFDLNSSIAVAGKEDDINTDYVLHLSKLSNSSTQSQTAFANDLTVFNTENTVNIKANKSDHVLSIISIFDLSGKLILEKNNVFVGAGNITSINIDELAKGMYIVHINDESNNILSKKIIK